MSNDLLTIDATKLKHMFLVGSQEVAEKQDYINELNVFPVPDGDTGTNMTISCQGASDIIKNTKYTELFTLGKQFSRGLLMNARGNSGVILSQIFKGFSSNFAENQKELDVPSMIVSFEKAKEVAYAAVATPVEGTILTVIRMTSDYLTENAASFKTIDAVLEATVKKSEEVLAQTPEMLKDLKEAGVVDSGGYGLVQFFKGMLKAISLDEGKEYKEEENKEIDKKKSIVSTFADNNEGFGYCNEFIMTLKSKVTLAQKDKETFDLTDFKKQMGRLGDSMVVVVDDNLVKVHIHSAEPYRILEFASKYGEFNKVKVENMTNQFLERNPGTTLEELVNRTKTTKHLSTKPQIIATVPSETLSEIFKKTLKAKVTINSEISGNPSIQEFIDAINAAKTSRIIIVLDDTNVVLAAKEAKALVASKKIECEIISTRDVVASYLVCQAYNPEEDFEENSNEMQKVMKKISYGKISKSVKDIKFSHISVKKDDYIGIVEKKIIVGNTDFEKAAKATIDNIASAIKKKKHATIIAGRDLLQNNLNYIKKYLAESLGLSIEVIDGKQDVYFVSIAIY
ncbi:MAG: DAK2 domain-containing protein [Mycoplasmataceae bacterium]|jgi:DAK2 domain fusion protein YloV|nr:DAK2 domain-containing protein [Mycoplasmataceae bacterium]